MPVVQLVDFTFVGLDYSIQAPSRHADGRRQLIIRMAALALIHVGSVIGKRLTLSTLSDQGDFRLFADHRAIGVTLVRFPEVRDTSPAIVLMN